MPADHHQRQRALDPARSFIVQAPAGSGKTEVLTQRFLNLLATVSRPERVLAITFTRKATQEMRTRITRRLAQARAGERPGSEHEHRAVALAARVLERDHELGWHLLRNPGRLRITTIDGLCVQLLARDPVHGARMARVQVLDDPKPLHREAVRRLFADLDAMATGRDGGEAAREAQEALVRLLVNLEGDAGRLEALLMDMLLRRSLWKRHLDTARPNLDDLLRERQAFALESFRQELGERALTEAMDLARVPVCDAGTEQAEIDAQLRRTVSFARLLSTKALKPRAPRSVNPGLFPGMDDADAPAFDRLKAIYAAWHEDDAARDALERMAAWPPLDLSTATGPRPDALLDDARRVLSLALFELDTLMAETGQADFTAVSDAALESLGDETAPADTLLAEDARISHILMDEFQDTSYTQFRLLRRLTAGWEPGDGRSLFLVGDPMQSIYRFREANVGFFNEVMQTGRVGQVPVEPLTLTSNFRSNAELIDWFNQTFSSVFPARDESDSGAVSYTAVHSELGKGGSVELHALPEDDGEVTQGRRVAELVSAALKDPANESIAVLVRARGKVREITAELAAADIAFEAVRMGGLAGRSVVRDLEAITRALVHPMDRVAWIALLRAPWCGLTVAEIHQLVGEDPSVEVFGAMATALEKSLLAGDSHLRLQHLHEVLARARRSAASHSLVRRVEMCWIRLGGPLCCNDPSDIENAETFFELLEETEQGGGRQIVERLEEALEARYAASRPARVQLMTIHNAKGLEFDVVIVPDLARPPRTGRQPLVALQEFAGEAKSGVLMAAMTPAWMSEASLFRYLNKVDAERDRFESQRVLYVACTRARRRLHLVAKVGITAAGAAKVPAHSFLAFLKASFGPHLERLVEQTEDSAADVSKSDIQPPAFPLIRLRDALPQPEFAQAAPPPEAKAIRDLPNPSAVALGTVLHQWLELIHDCPGQDWSEARIENYAVSIRACLARAGAPRQSLDELQARGVEILKSAVNDDGLMALIGPRKEGPSWSELPIYRRKGNGFSRHVIDLLVRDRAGALRIVDYKTSESPGPDGTVEVERQAQLEGYRELVENLWGEPVSEAGVHVLERKRTV